MKKKSVCCNPVAKHINRFNKAQTHVDRKKALRKGYTKHMAKRYELKVFGILNSYRFFRLS